MARILVADDDIDVCTLVATMLRRQGHLVSTAGDGEQALRVATSETPDIAVVDLMMPRLDGYELTKALRADARTAGLGIVVLTARAGGVDRKFAFTVGADAFVRKPFTASDLAEGVRVVTER